jgi:hypothetical protein
MECGPDESTGAGQEAKEVRQVWVAPYVDTVESAFSQYRSHAQEGLNQQGAGWKITQPIGAAVPYPAAGAYQSRDGVLLHTAPNGRFTFGLASHSQIDRVAVVNWGVAVETFYL